MKRPVKLLPLLLGHSPFPYRIPCASVSYRVFDAIKTYLIFMMGLSPQEVRSHVSTLALRYSIVCEISAFVKSG